MSASEMVEIPAGSFLMGSTRFYPEEAPVRETAVGGDAANGRARERRLRGS
jgi:formylglycine-generating enzyme required for sulfatase activity